MQIKTSTPLRIFAFEKDDGSSPIREWLGEIKGSSIQKAVEGRIRRARRGNLGDVKLFRFVSRRNPVLLELRINVRSGPRLYAMPNPDGGLVLLNGGTKRRQARDIQVASDLHRACSAQKGRLRPLKASA